jgi:hypothetical protein
MQIKDRDPKFFKLPFTSMLLLPNTCRNDYPAQKMNSRALLSKEVLLFTYAD